MSIQNIIIVLRHSHVKIYYYKYEQFRIKYRLILPLKYLLNVLKNKILLAFHSNRAELYKKEYLCG